MTRRLLLDTWAALLLLAGELSLAAAAMMNDARLPGGVGISPITAWEVSLLVARGRLALTLSVRTRFARLVALEGARWLDLSSDILIAANELPGDLHRDPADRILAATARSIGYALITRDWPLLAYAEAGHLHAIPC